MSSVEILAKKKLKEVEKGTYEMRKNQILLIRSNMYNFTDENVERINGKIDSLCEILSDGIKGISVKDNYIVGMQTMKEDYIGTDFRLRECDNYIYNELEDCKTKIEELENEISDLSIQYAQALLEETKKIIEVTGPFINNMTQPGPYTVTDF